VQKNSDLGNQSDCILFTDNNDNGCKVEQLAKRYRSNNDFDPSLNGNYETVIGDIRLMCSDALFE
jgi:hypothetical protein